jgi:hypothetical protein
MRPDVLEFNCIKNKEYIHWLGKGESGNFEWAFRFYRRKSDRSNRLSAYHWNPSGGLGAGAYSQEELAADDWLHLVACFPPGNASVNNAGVSLYKNGVLAEGPPAPGTLYSHPDGRWRIFPTAGDSRLRLGTRDNKRRCLVGGLAEVAIYPRVLTEHEAQEHSRAGREFFPSSSTQTKGHGRDES